MGTANVKTKDEVAEEETALLRDIQVDAYLLDCVRLDPEALDEEFVRLPADLAYWNERYAESIHRQLMAKHQADKVQAAVLLEVREQAVQSGLKMTVDDVKARVTIDQRVADAEVELVEAEAAMRHARVRVDSVMAKRDMLQSLGAKIRMEMQDPVVREQYAGRRMRG